MRLLKLPSRFKVRLISAALICSSFTISCKWNQDATNNRSEMSAPQASSNNNQDKKPTTPATKSTNAPIFGPNEVEEEGWFISDLSDDEKLNLVSVGLEEKISALKLAEETSSSASAESFAPYDVNNDGRVTSLDSLAIINEAAREGVEYNERFDVNKDGKVTSLDALIVINYIDRIQKGPVSELLLSESTFHEASANDGSIANTISITVKDSYFVGQDFELGTHYTLTSLPAGLTAKVTRQSDEVITLELTGKASSHESANDQSLTMTVLKGALISGKTPINEGKLEFLIDFKNKPQPKPRHTVIYRVDPNISTYGLSKEELWKGINLAWKVFEVVGDIDFREARPGERERIYLSSGELYLGNGYHARGIARGGLGGRHIQIHSGYVSAGHWKRDGVYQNEPKWWKAIQSAEAVKTIVMHEVGHAWLSWPHSSVRECMMHAWGYPQMCENEKRFIRNKYGASQNPDGYPAFE